ncbi:TonB-dependent receptor [Fibrisoma montanum]|uniref:TonB-dependent receptor n=1 Tax=Fibrisoma montanum TaxID=2305895 RepID=A0A418MHS4_9BACT|nr:outer membrane beta-barrel family protein [Fibrisoma montanum]RIV26891.1 TonB-dependent receptor [Fibrisoma montanum]
MKSICTFLAVVLVTVTTAFGQIPTRGKVYGQVGTVAGKPLEFTTMMLLKAKDSTLVKGAVSDAVGHYEFENVGAGEYLVAAQQIGYRKAYSQRFALDEARPAVEVPALAMTDETQNLSEVKVVAKKPFIEQQVDRTVVNVENSIVASGNTALEVLEKAPGVTIDRQNDQIQLKGKSGVIVYIDGKQTYLSGQEVANLLKNTPSDNIEKIEIITNPGSKYDAAGNSGIINIKMKKNKNFGTNGTWVAGLGMGRFEKYNTSLNLNHREGKINVFGNYSYFHNRRFQENELNRLIPFNGTVTYFDQKSYRPNRFDGHTYRAGLDYFVSKKSTIGVLATGFINDWNQYNAVNNTIIRNAAGEITLKPTTAVTVQNKWTNLTGNLNYKYEFNGKGRELTADMDYSRYNGDSYNNLVTTYRNAQDEIEQPTETVRNDMPSVIDIWAFKSDYVHPTKKGKWETGIKSSYVQSDNNLVFENLLDNRWVLNENQSNRFKYQENINAVYANYSGKLDKKTSLQFGLRVEQTHSKGNSVTLNRVVDRNYTNLFPTLFLSRQLDTSNVLNFSYSRRIDRPNYQNLNPFRFYLDPYTYQQGNPYLKPQFTNSYQLTHVYKGSFSTSLSYSRTTDVIVNEVPGQIPEQNITYVTSDNLATQDNVSLTMSFPLPIRKWWNMQNNITVFYNKFDSPYLGAQYNVDFVAYNLYSSNTFTLGKGFSAELAGWYNSKGLYGFYRYQPQGAFSVGLQKTVLNKKGTLKLNVNDPFWLNQFKGYAKYQDIDFRITSRWESRVARVTFTYRFGNQNVKAARQRSTSTEAERNRAGGGSN